MMYSAQHYKKVQSQKIMLSYGFKNRAVRVFKPWLDRSKLFARFLCALNSDAAYKIHWTPNFFYSIVGLKEGVQGVAQYGKSFVYIYRIKSPRLIFFHLKVQSPSKFLHSLLLYYTSQFKWCMNQYI